MFSTIAPSYSSSLNVEVGRELFSYYSSSNLSMAQSDPDFTLSEEDSFACPLWKMRVTEDFKDGLQRVYEGDVLYGCAFNLNLVILRGDDTLTIPFSKLRISEGSSSGSDSGSERPDSDDESSCFDKYTTQDDDRSITSYNRPDDKTCMALVLYSSQTFKNSNGDNQQCECDNDVPDSAPEPSLSDTSEEFPRCICRQRRKYERRFYRSRRIKEHDQLYVIFKRVRFLVDPCGHCWELPGCPAIEDGNSVHGHEISLRDDDAQQTGWFSIFRGTPRSSAYRFMFRCCQLGFSPEDDTVDEVEFRRYAGHSDSDSDSGSGSDGHPED